MTNQSKVAEERAAIVGIAVKTSRELGEMSERERIVAWLRTYPSVIGLDEMTAWNVAAHLERGDHLKDQDHGRA